MHDYSYSAHLVINDGYEDRLDMTITCQNAQQLLRAKDLIADQMNAYIAEFAVQSGLTGVLEQCRAECRCASGSHSGAD